MFRIVAKHSVGFRRLFLYAAVFIFCMHADVSAETILPPKYNPVKIADSVITKYGAASWSPDSGKIAYISTSSLNIYDIKTGAQKKAALNNPYYASWSMQGDLFVLCEENGKKSLYRIDADNLSAKRLNIDKEPDAVFPAIDGRRLLILFSKMEKSSIGYVVDYWLDVYDMKSGAVKNLYQYSRILPKRFSDAGSPSGWSQQNISLSDTKMLIMEYINPPAAADYVRVLEADYVTANIREIGVAKHWRFPVSGAWSPDGKRIAFPGKDGLLSIIDLNGAIADIEADVAGYYPSWNPEGSQIFFGGYLISSDGKVKDEILRSGAKGIALWSPDGAKMALLNDKNLWLLEGFKPYFIPPDSPLVDDTRKGILILKELLADGLLTEEEYLERYDKIFKKVVGR